MSAKRAILLSAGYSTKLRTAPIGGCPVNTAIAVSQWKMVTATTKRVDLKGLLVRQRAVVCRGATCFATRQGVAKFSWRSDKRQLSEVKLLKLAQEKNVEGVATLMGHRELTSIADLRADLDFSGSTRHTFRTTTPADQTDIIASKARRAAAPAENASPRTIILDLPRGGDPTVKSLHLGSPTIDEARRMTKRTKRNRAYTRQAERIHTRIAFFPVLPFPPQDVSLATSAPSANCLRQSATPSER